MQALKVLPKGRHKLSRREVVASQRTRLLQAAVELGAERGLAKLTLADIVSRARVARSTFYEHFADKQQCFLATFDYAAERVLEQVLEIRPPGTGGVESVVNDSIARLLTLAQQEPGLVRLVATDAEALGPAAAERQRAITARLADGLMQLREFLRRNEPRLAPISQLRALAIVGAITEVLRHSFYTRGSTAFPELHAELSALVRALLEAPQS